MSAAAVVYSRPGDRYGVATCPAGFHVVDLEHGACPCKVGNGHDGAFTARGPAEQCARQMSRCEPIHGPETHHA